jgi:hypothetical protein
MDLSTLTDDEKKTALDALLREWTELRREILSRIDLQQRLMQASGLGTVVSLLFAKSQNTSTTFASIKDRHLLLIAALILATFQAVHLDQDRMITKLGWYLGTELIPQIREVSPVRFSWELYTKLARKAELPLRCSALRSALGESPCLWSDLRQLTEGTLHS